MKNVETSCIIVCLIHRDISLFTMGTDAYITKRKMIIIFIIILRRSLFLLGVLRKGAQELCELTGGSILAGMSVCRIVNTHPMSHLGHLREYRFKE